MNVRIVRLVVVLGAFLVPGSALVEFGCGTSRPQAAAGEGTNNGVSESCSTPGATRDCKYVVGETNGVRTCGPGMQTCSESGFWGPCGGGGITSGVLLQSVNLSPASNGGVQLLNINPATDGGAACSNPCDPACTGFNESCSGIDGGLLDGSSDGGSPTTFPATSFPACPATAISPNSQTSCDCQNTPGATCGQYCDSRAGCEAIGRSNKTTNNFRCNSVSGLCDFKCETGTTCNVDCNSTGTCSTTCLPGSVCNIACNSVTSCPVNCAPGATCTITACNSSSCPVSSVAVQAAGTICFQTPPFQVPNVAAPGAQPGAVNSLFADQCRNSGGPNSRACEVGPYGASATDLDGGLMASTCQADSYCRPTALAAAGDPNAGCCVPFGSNQTHGTQNSGLTCSTSGPDLTIPGACRVPAGGFLLSICNRGNAQAVGPIQVGEDNAFGGIPPHNSGTTAAPNCYGTAQGSVNRCRYDGTIDPGKCVNLLSTAPLGSGCGGAALATGASLWVVNPNGVSPECQLDPKNTVAPNQAIQPGCANNLAVFGAPGQLVDCLGGFTPTQMTQEYTATCSPGQVPKWTTLGWRGTTPSSGAQSTRIEFFATLEGTTYDGAAASPAGPQLIGRAVPTPNSAVYVEGGQQCLVYPTSTNPTCPKNLANTIGAPAPTGFGPTVLNYSKLTLDIFLYPSANASLVPTLQDWWISYTCVDYE